MIVKNLKEKYNTCNTCDKCINDCKVFGYGNTNADLMIIGESPGKDEAEAGVPFIGQAG